MDISIDRPIFIQKKSSKVIVEQDIHHLQHIWELPGNYPVFTVVMVIYHYVERIWRIIYPPDFTYKIYDHEKYYPGEPVNIHI